MCAITGLDHIGIYVRDLQFALEEYRTSFGFALDRTDDLGATAGPRRAALRQGRIRLVLTEGRGGDDPASAYTNAHGDGIADIALRVDDAPAAFDAAVARGARPVRPPHVVGTATVATITGFGDVVHSLVERTPVPDEELAPAVTVHEVDHFALCVGADELDPTIEFYERVLGFRCTFGERIEVGDQAMDSKVVSHPEAGVTFTVLAPDPARAAGQLDTFLKSHGGPGVQHVAFGTDDAVRAVDGLRERGVEFLVTPGAYYDVLGERVIPRGHSVEELRASNLLVDQDHGGQLFQIFTRSTHERRTLFHEIVERVGARSFGTANIRALYEAVQREQDNREE